VPGAGRTGARAYYRSPKSVADIERRLQRLGDRESGPFRPLVAELRDELAAVRRENLLIQHSAIRYHQIGHFVMQSL
jgi:hypothetical protein